MENLYIGLTVFFILIIAATLYYYIKPITPIKQSNLMQKEVFILKVRGSQNLGHGQLSSGFVYAREDQINSAIQSGLTVSGLQKGDVILYESINNAPGSSNTPNAMIATGNEFTSGVITFTPTLDITYNVIYWVCVYGFKPSQAYGQDFWRFFKTESYTIMPQDFHGVQSFNQTVWSLPQTRDAIDSEGNEVIWISIDSGKYSPSSVKQINADLTSGYTLATLNQYLWSYANGLGTDQTQILIVGQNDPSIDNPFYLHSKLTSNLDKNNGLYMCNTSLCTSFIATEQTLVPGFVIAIWGQRVTDASSYSNLNNVVQVNFNGSKVSQYS